MSRPFRRGGNGQSPRSRGWDRSVTPDYYALLNVVPDADREIIRAAYLVLAKRYHPDTATAAFPHNVEKFQLLTEAYEVLRDPNRRALYDWHHARQKRVLAQREKFEQARLQALEQAQRRQGERSREEEEQEHQEARARAKSRSPSALRNPLIFSVGGLALAALVFGLIKAPGPNNLATNSDLAMHTEKFEPSSSLLSDKAARNQKLTDLRQALRQAQTAAAASQESLAQERDRNRRLEEQLAARQDATPGRTQGGNRPATMASEALTAAASEAAQAKQAAERSVTAEKALPEQRARADALARDLDAAQRKIEALTAAAKATASEAAKAKEAAERAATEQRARADALARDLEAAQRKIEALTAAASAANGETARVREDAMRGAEALQRSQQQERARTDALERDLAAVRREFEAQVNAPGKVAEEATRLQQTAERAAAELRDELQEEHYKAEKLARELAAAWRELETQATRLAKTGDKAAQNQELTDLRQALRQAQTAAAASQESLAQERDRNRRLEEQLAARQDATPGRPRSPRVTSR